MKTNSVADDILNNVIIAIDLMGGDNAPGIVITGLLISISKNPDIRFKLFGTQAACAKLPKEVLDVSEIIITESVISGDESVSQALLSGRGSSMALALKCVVNKQAHAAVSSGNTGALMAMSKIFFKTLDGISRPAIASIIPSKKSYVVFLDMGANTECDAQNFFEFAIMGMAFAKNAFDVPSPKVAILNIGSEKGKGTETVNKAYSMFESSIFAKDFLGFIEGDKICEGDANVIVTDGFSGNLVLKTLEGSGRLWKYFIKSHLKESILGKIGFFIALPMFKKILKRVDPNKYNGALFVGLNGIAIKSHGSATGKGFANAIKVAYNLAKNDINTKLKNEICKASKGN